MSAWPAHLGALRAPDDAMVAAARARLGAAPRDGEPGPPTDRGATWSYAWPAGERFARELARVVDSRGRRVADLGCGRGHLGLAALLAGAREVLFADGHPDAVARVAATLVANGLEQRARAVVHAWGAALPDGPYHAILGGDVLYRPECFAALLDTVAASLSPGGACWLADPRVALEDELSAQARARRLSWTIARRDGYTLASVRRG